MTNTANSAPAPGRAPMPAANAAALLRRNATDPDISQRPAIRFGDQVWSHREYFDESARWANLFLANQIDGRPLHVAVLLDNTPDYLFAFGGAALVGAAIVGLNHTRRDEHLLRDIQVGDACLLITEPRHQSLLASIADRLPFGPDRILVSSRFAAPGEVLAKPGRSLDEALDSQPATDPGIDPDPSTTWALIFTSGTSDHPKAVICSQRRLLVTGNRFTMVLGVGPVDVGYICMPLFHSNALMVGWAPSIVAGASVGLGRKFSASGWLPDVRRYGATYFNYTGKPLAYILSTPQTSSDSDNTLRVAFGNEGAPDLVARFSERFGVEVIDAYGATEGGVAVNRDVEPRPGALGQAPENVRVVNEEGKDLPKAAFDDAGHLTNADECVGEIVNTAGVGPFEGYYNNDDANEATTRFGWYWTGDLGYLDDDRYLYFAGRNADWIRVDGENFPAGPIETALARHPQVIVAAVYGVPDVEAGDQVMASLVMSEGANFDPVAFAAWLDEQADLGPKWRPRYIRVATELPNTGTLKVVKRTLVHQKFRRDRIGEDALYVRLRGEESFAPFTTGDEAALLAGFTSSGRDRFWDL